MSYDNLRDYFIALKKKSIYIIFMDGVGLIMVLVSYFLIGEIIVFGSGCLTNLDIYLLSSMVLVIGLFGLLFILDIYREYKRFKVYCRDLYELQKRKELRVQG